MKLNVSQVMLLGLVLRVGVSFWNGFFGPSLGAEQDATGLHVLAVDLVTGQSTLQYQVTLSYAYFLAFLYWLVGPSAFVGGLVSCVAWSISADLLRRSMRLLHASVSAQMLAMLTYALFPSSVLWTSVTMREPYQLLLVNFLTYCALQIGVAHSRRHWLMMPPAVACGVTLHAALVAWGAMTATATALWAMLNRRVWRRPVQLLVTSAVIIAAVVTARTAFSTVFSYPLENGLAAAVESYQRGGLVIGARTNYRREVSIESTEALVRFVPVSLLQYLFEPMPWRVSAPGDMPILLENLLRLLLLLQAIYFVFASGAQRRALVFLLGVFVALETTWSLGTFNWGTATRHHLPSLGLLVLAAFAGARRSAGDLADEARVPA